MYRILLIQYLDLEINALRNRSDDIRKIVAKQSSISQKMASYFFKSDQFDVIICGKNASKGCGMQILPFNLVIKEEYEGKCEHIV